MTTGGKRFLCLAAAAFLAISAAGCGGGKKAEEARALPKEDATVRAVGIDEGELTSAAVVMAVGEKAVSSAEAMFYLDEVRRRYEPAMGREIWDVSLEEGESLSDYVKEAIISEITEVKIICQEAARQNVTLTDDERLEAEKLAESYREEHADTAGRYKITQELARQIYEDHMLADKMFDVTTAAVNTDISDETVRQITVQVLSVLTEGTDKNGAVISMNPEQKEKARKRAKELLKKAKQAESFYNFAEVNGDNGQIELTFGQEDKPDEFGEMALSMKTGAYSGVIEGESGYYILYCVNDFDKDRTLAKKESMIAREQDKIFQKTYREWSKNYEVLVSDKLWNQIRLS